MSFGGPREQVCFVQSWMSRRPAANGIGIISFAWPVQQLPGTSLEIAIRESASSQQEMEAAKMLRSHSSSDAIRQAPAHGINSHTAKRGTGSSNKLLSCCKKRQRQHETADSQWTN